MRRLTLVVLVLASGGNAAYGQLNKAQTDKWRDITKPLLASAITEMKLVDFQVSFLNDQIPVNSRATT